MPLLLPCLADVGRARTESQKTLQLGVFFGLWYLFNIYFNIYNKQVRTRAIGIPSPVPRRSSPSVRA